MEHSFSPPRSRDYFLGPWAWKIIEHRANLFGDKWNCKLFRQLRDSSCDVLCRGSSFGRNLWRGCVIAGCFYSICRFALGTRYANRLAGVPFAQRFFHTKWGIRVRSASPAGKYKPAFERRRKEMESRKKMGVVKKKALNTCFSFF